MSRTDVLGVGFDNVTKAEAVERALELIDAREGRYVVTPNPDQRFSRKLMTAKPTI